MMSSEKNSGVSVPLPSAQRGEGRGRRRDLVRGGGVGRWRTCRSSPRCSSAVRRLPVWPRKPERPPGEPGGLRWYFDIVYVEDLPRCRAERLAVKPWVPVMPTPTGLAKPSAQPSELQRVEHGRTHERGVRHRCRSLHRGGPGHRVLVPVARCGGRVDPRRGTGQPTTARAAGVKGCDARSCHVRGRRAPRRRRSAGAGAPADGPGAASRRRSRRRRRSPRPTRPRPPGVRGRRPGRSAEHAPRADRLGPGQVDRIVGEEQVVERAPSVGAAGPA